MDDIGGIGSIHNISDAAVQQALALYIDEKERAETPDRARWRQYACAALAGLNADPHYEGSQTDTAANQADTMLALEKARFVGGTK